MWGGGGAIDREADRRTDGQDIHRQREDVHLTVHKLEPHSVIYSYLLKTLQREKHLITLFSFPSKTEKPDAEAKPTQTLHETAPSFQTTKPIHSNHPGAVSEIHKTTNLPVSRLHPPSALSSFVYLLGYRRGRCDKPDS